MATVTAKIASFGNDDATIVVTTDTVKGCYTNVAVVCKRGTLTVNVVKAGLQTLAQDFTKDGSLLVPNTSYLISSADVQGVWKP